MICSVIANLFQKKNHELPLSAFHPLMETKKRDDSDEKAPINVLKDIFIDNKPISW